MSGPATLTRLVVDRCYEVLGEEGLRYLGQDVAGLHRFERTRPPSGFTSIDEPRLLELMTTGRIVPEGPRA